MRRRRPSTTIALSGRGVHSGDRAIAVIVPARWGSGIRVARADKSWAVEPETVTAGSGNTGVGEVATVEHALAALVLLGITDATIRVDATELPILDGSAGPWVRALRRAGQELGPMRPIAPSRPTTVTTATGHARWTPGPVDRITVHVAFDSGPRGSATHDLSTPPPDALIDARTFALARDLAHLRRAGRGRGADSTNTTIVRPGDRDPAPVLHLLLDAIGDRAQAGLIRGEAELWAPSHALGAALWRAVRPT